MSVSLMLFHQDELSKLNEGRNINQIDWGSCLAVQNQQIQNIILLVSLDWSLNLAETTNQPSTRTTWPTHQVAFV